MVKSEKRKKETIPAFSDESLSGRGNPFVVSGVEILPDQISIGENLVQAYELGFWPPTAVPGFMEEMLPDAASTLVIQAQPQSTSLMINPTFR